MNPHETLTIRTPQDLIALIPRSFGFHPTESVVLAAFDGHRPFQARADLCHETMGHLVSMLVSPAIAHAMSSVALLFYSDNDDLIAQATRRLTRRLSKAHVPVFAVLQVHGDRFRVVGDSIWTAYDVSGHAMTRSAAAKGAITYQNRDELAASLEPDPARVGEIDRLLRISHTSESCSSEKDERWVQSLFSDDRVELAAAEIARLLVALKDITLRDAAWTAHDAARADTSVALWRQVLTAAPAGYVIEPASMLCFAAWLSGNGALAWCAWEIAHKADPGYRMAGMMQQVLARGLPPQMWRAMEAS